MCVSMFKWGALSSCFDLVTASPVLLFVSREPHSRIASANFQGLRERTHFIIFIQYNLFIQNIICI